MDIVRHSIIIASVVGIVAWLLWSLRNRHRWLYAIAPLSWLINTLAFSVFRELAIPMSVSAMNIWSGVVRLHGVILLAGVAIMEIRRRNA